jgi:hypothetical protein
MNVFRLFLCLAGLVTFLVIRHFSQPAPAAGTSLLPAPNLALPAFPQVEPSPSEPSSVIRSLELEGQIVSVRSGPEGVTYDLVSPHGTNLASNLNERQFRRDHPNLYGLVRDEMNRR